MFAHADDGPNHHVKRTLEIQLDTQRIADLHTEYSAVKG